MRTLDLDLQRSGCDKGKEVKRWLKNLWLRGLFDSLFLWEMLFSPHHVEEWLVKEGKKKKEKKAWCRTCFFPNRPPEDWKALPGKDFRGNKLPKTEKSEPAGRTPVQSLEGELNFSLPSWSLLLSEARSAAGDSFSLTRYRFYGNSRVTGTGTDLKRNACIRWRFVRRRSFSTYGRSLQCRRVLTVEL